MTFAPYCFAVAISWPVIKNPPSPTCATTNRPGWASFAATAYGTPDPMQPKVGEMYESGCSNSRYRCGHCPKLPASVVVIASEGNVALRSAITRSIDARLVGRSEGVL